MFFNLGFLITLPKYVRQVLKMGFKDASRRQAATICAQNWGLNRFFDEVRAVLVVP
jgi:hypothetical protein